MGLHNLLDTQVATVSQSPSSSCEATMTKSILSSKRVHFSDSITCINDHLDVVMSDAQQPPEQQDQPVSSWYTQKDFDKFRAINLAMLQEGRQSGCYLDNEDWTPRGFEYVIQRYPRKRLRYEHLNRVLEFQQNLYIDCPAALGDYAASSSFASGCLERARALGVSDEQAVRGVALPPPATNKMDRLARACPTERCAPANMGSLSKLKNFFRCY